MKSLQKIVSILLTVGMSVSVFAQMGVSAAVKQGVTEYFVDTGFESTVESAGLVKVGKWGTTNAATYNYVTIDNTDASNPVLKLSQKDYNVGVDYTIPTDKLSETYQMHISYKFKMADTSYTCFSSLYTANATLQNASLQNSNQAENVKPVWVSGGKLLYGNNGAYAEGTPQEIGTLTANQWYTVNTTVNVRNTARVLASTTVVNEDGTLFGSYGNVALSGRNVNVPTHFTIMGSDAVYIDDLKIGFTYDKNVSSNDISVDFSESDALTHFNRWDIWDNENLSQISVDTVSGNKVLKFAKETGKNKQIALDYKLPETLPDSYTMTIKYKMYMSAYNLFYLFVTPSGTPTQGKGIIKLSGNALTGTPLSITNSTLGYFGSHTYPTNGDAFVSLDNPFEFGKWYDVTAKLDVTNGSKPTSTVRITKEGSSTPITYSATIGAKNCTSIERVQFWYNPQTADSYMYLDDLSFEFSYNENTLTDSKFIFNDATEEAFSAAPAKKVRGAKLSLGSDRNIIATLASQSSNVAVTVTADENDSKIKTLSWDTLTEGETYTLTVDYGAYDPLVYTFTEPESVLEITALDFYKNGEIITDMSSVSVGDTLTLKATCVNSSGITKDAVLIIAAYSSDRMTTVAQISKNIEYGNSVQEFDFTVTSEMQADEIGGFIWNNLTDIVPLHTSARID